MAEDKDVYSHVATRLGLSRAEAKNQVTRAIYGDVDEATVGPIVTRLLRAVVEAEHVDPEAYFDEADGSRYCIFADKTSGVAVGLGMSELDAWRDAARNVLRPPVPPRVQHGSPTMSLKSDEQFWKKECRS
jgi:hypothetical protein